MRRLLTVAGLAALVPAGAAIATSPPDTTAPVSTVTETTMVTEMTMVTATSMVSETIAGEATTSLPVDTPATVYDESGDPVAAVTVVGSQSPWGDYAEGDEPDEGREYMQMTVKVESLMTEGTFTVNVDHFILQDNNGFVTTAQSVRSAAQAETGEEPSSESELATAEAAEMTLTFEVTTSVGPQSVFYRPDDERLVDIAEFS